MYTVTVVTYYSQHRTVQGSYVSYDVDKFENIVKIIKVDKKIVHVENDKNEEIFIVPSSLSNIFIRGTNEKAQ